MWWFVWILSLLEDQTVLGFDDWNGIHMIINYISNASHSGEQDETHHHTHRHTLWVSVRWLCISMTFATAPPASRSLTDTFFLLLYPELSVVCLLNSILSLSCTTIFWNVLSIYNQYTVLKCVKIITGTDVSQLRASKLVNPHKHSAKK